MNIDNLFSHFNKFSELSCPEKYQDGIYNLVNELKLNSVDSKVKAKFSSNKQEVPFTVYGVKSLVSTCNKAVSLSGLNVKCVRGDGAVDAEGVRELIQKVFGEDKFNKSLINKFVNEAVNALSEENHVALAYNLLVLWYKMIFYERTPQTDIEVVIPRSDTISQGDLRSNLINFIRSQYCGIDECDPEIDRLVSLLELKRQPGTSAKEQRLMCVATFPLTLNWKVWTVDKYDDGHTVIDESRYIEAGFTHRKFKVPNDFDLVTVDNDLVEYQYGFPTTADLITRMWEKEFSINVNNYSDSQRVIIYHVIRNMRRNSPFLVDQPADIFRIDNESKVVFWTNRQTTLKNVVINSKSVLALISKIVPQLRIHDDFIEAIKLLIPNLIQPHATTVEAHAWFNLDKVVTLPIFRSVRGLLPLLTNDVPFNIHPQGYAIVANLHEMDVWLQAHAVVFNAAIQWSYFCNYINHKDDAVIQKVLTADNELLNQDVSSFLPAFMCIATGKRSWMYTQVGNGVIFDLKTRIQEQTITIKFDRKKKGTVLFGEEKNNYLIINRIVAPSAMPVVIGLGGPVFSGTPLDSSFCVEQVEPKVINGKRFIRSNYINLWAYSLVNRWNGYNVKLYKHEMPGCDTFVPFAANQDQLITPMDIPDFIYGDHAYRATTTYEREHVFADPVPLNSKTNWVWECRGMRVHEGVNRKGALSNRTCSLVKGVKQLKVSTQLLTSYKIYLRSEGDNESGFRFYQEVADEQCPPSIQVMTEIVSESQGTITTEES